MGRRKAAGAAGRRQGPQEGGRAAGRRQGPHEGGRKPLCDGGGPLGGGKCRVKQKRWLYVAEVSHDGVRGLLDATLQRVVFRWSRRRGLREVDRNEGEEDVARAYSLGE
jgi:hypothetical protein